MLAAMTKVTAISFWRRIIMRAIIKIPITNPQKAVPNVPTLPAILFTAGNILDIAEGRSIPTPPPESSTITIAVKGRKEIFLVIFALHMLLFIIATS